MKQRACDNEMRVLESLGKGSGPEVFDRPLQAHVASCDACAEVVSIYEIFQQDSRQLCEVAPVPEAGRVWWRAVLAARQTAAERALRPIRIAERAALAVGGGVLIALLVFAAPWVVHQLARSSTFPGAIASTVPLTSLIFAGIGICILLMAGALFALWAER